MEWRHHDAHVRGTARHAQCRYTELSRLCLPPFAAARPGAPTLSAGADTQSHLEKEQKEAERKVIEARGRANSIEVINQALARNPNYIKYLYVDKLSDKIQVIVSDQNTIMDLKGILGGKQ